MSGLRWRDDEGNAVLEVALLAPVLLVPLVWLAVSVAVVTTAHSAVISAARQAARAYVLAPDARSAGSQARQVAVAVLATNGRQFRQHSVRITCNTACLTPNSRVDIRVSAVVTLGFIPIPFRSSPSVTIVATQSALVDPYRNPTP